MCKSNEQGAPQGAGCKPLGIKTKSTSPCEACDGDLGKFRNIRKERYQLSRAARAIYAKQGEKEGYKHVLNYHRTAKCAYIAHDDVRVHVSSEYDKAFLSGVTACGSVHTCPICSAKIEERRRGEISKAVDFWYSLENKTVSMITFTFSHSLGERLKDVLSKQADALNRLRSGKAWNSFREVFGFDSLIRSLEVTWGEEHGWHPHTHELWCIDKEINRERLSAYLKAKFKAKRHAERLERLLSAEPTEVFEELLLERWEACCERAGLMVKPDGTPVSLDAFRQHALDIKHGVSVGDYLAKQDDSRHWGVDREMAKGSTKKGKKKGMHPFGFLSRFAETGDGVWSGRWLEYSEAIEGKRRLFWSHGLKERVGLNEKTDEEIAAEQDDHAVIVYQMLDGEWRKARHNVPRVLAAAEDDENLREVIEEIEELDFYTAEPEAVETRTEGISFKVIQDIADEFREELKRA
ncbi:protein rep [Vibrio parahaemolyticus]|uniref:protein rep n=1 Tax=Vibrio parahaemolyticus TaxID=670 RepID=UPI0012ADB009|nr:protein rep [Vibrio parahaemolyticus]